MSHDQLVFLLVELLVLLGAAAGTLGWKYLLKRAESAGAQPSAKALEEVRADLARVTHASGLYVQRQHEVFADLYRYLRRARDNLALVVGHGRGLRHDVVSFTREELEEQLKTVWRGPALREVLGKWEESEEARREAVRLLQSKLPVAYFDLATDHLTEATKPLSGQLALLLERWNDGSR